MVSAAAISDRIWLYLLLNSITSRRILRVVGRMEDKSAIMAVMSEIILNLYQHNHIGSGASNSISVVIEASFFLRLLDGHSITQNGRWIPTKVNYQEIYTKMPKCMDRWKLLLRKRKRRRKKHIHWE